MKAINSIRIISLGSMTTIIHFCNNDKELDKVEDYLFFSVAEYEHSIFNVLSNLIDTKRRILNT